MRARAGSHAIGRDEQGGVSNSSTTFSALNPSPAYDRPMGYLLRRAIRIWRLRRRNRHR